MVPENIGCCRRHWTGRPVWQHDQQHQLALDSPETSSLQTSTEQRVHLVSHENFARKHLTKTLQSVPTFEYIWSAGWCFFGEADPAAEEWVAEKALSVLNGHASTVAASIRRKATCLDLDPQARKNADRCADYLLAKRDYLHYPQALSAGWPVATGVIEGACRHLVKDRLDLTGSRWGLAGAEAILKLRAIRCNGDFNEYWQFHLQQERRRVHESSYANEAIPRAA